MNYSKKARDQYNIDRERTCTALGITKNQYNWFRRKGAELHKIYENNCNGIYETEKEYDNAKFGLETALDLKSEMLSLHMYLQTDPRGATVYLDTEAIPENAYNVARCIL